MNHVSNTNAISSVVVPGIELETIGTVVSLDNSGKPKLIDEPRAVDEPGFVRFRTSF